MNPGDAASAGAVVVLGTVGLDYIETPRARADGVLGGSATYAALAARFFARPTVLSVVGRDFAPAHRGVLAQRGVDLSGLEVADGLTFRWGARYAADLNSRQTTFTDLNVLEGFDPAVPPHAARGAFVFLGNSEPHVQLSVLDQIEAPRFVLTDSMNIWIERDPAQLARVAARSGCMVLNDEETRQFGRDDNLPRAAQKILDVGAAAVVVKRGEHGASLLDEDGWFFAPGYPVSGAHDPTGAGDSFAGAFVGSLAEAGAADAAARRRAVVYGSVAASFTVESFGVARLAALTRAEIDARYAEFSDIVAF